MYGCKFEIVIYMRFYVIVEFIITRVLLVHSHRPDLSQATFFGKKLHQGLIKLITK